MKAVYFNALQRNLHLFPLARRRLDAPRRVELGFPVKIDSWVLLQAVPPAEAIVPIERLRFLVFLVWTAFLTPLLVYGVSVVSLFLAHTALAMPLFFPIDLDRIRQHAFWRWYPLVSLILFVAAYRSGLRGETAIYLLILFCLGFEYYGEKRSRAPTRLLGILSFLVVLSQFRYEHGLKLAAGGAIYLVTLVFVLICLERKSGRMIWNTGIVLRHIPAALFHTTWVMCLCLGVFWIIPRFSRYSLLSVPNSRANNVAAFSDRVSLNDIATLKLSKKHVMNITPVDGTVLHSRYLKCKVLDHYERGFWSGSFRQSKRVLYRREGGFYERHLPADFVGYSYRFNVKPMVGNSIFYFDYLVKIDAPFRLLYVTRTQSEIYLPFMYPSALNYRITCSKEPFFSWSRTNFDAFLQMPEDHEYLDQILQEIQADVGGSDPERLARSIISFFRTNYQYTLEINNFDVSDPLHEFLVNRREGHCELFASAMVLLLRRAGVPARLVTGFLMPDVHPSGDFYHITESNAHAWVEAHYQDAWHALDPTPPTEFVRPNFLDHQLARIERFWEDFVLNWTLQSQIDAFKRLGDAWWKPVRSHMQGDGAWRRWAFWAGIAVPLGMGLGVASFFVVWVRRRRSLQGLFLRLERRMTRRFGKKPSTMRWEHYVAGLPLGSDLKEQIQRVFDAYWFLRFGPKESGEEAPSVVRIRRQLADMEDRVSKAPLCQNREASSALT